VRGRLLRLKVVAAVLLVVFLVADLVSKQWLQDALVLRPGEHASARVWDVIPGFFALEGTWNPGVTFGLARGRTVEILALTSVATLALLTWLIATRNPSRLLHVGLGLIISGALGNLYDRITWHEVRDFFLVYWGDRTNPDDFHWPNFNVADSCIVVGVSLVILEALFGKAHGPQARAAAGKAA
jgi:signal peptidase II